MRACGSPSTSSSSSSAPSRSTTNSGIQFSSPSVGTSTTSASATSSTREHGAVDLGRAHADAAAVDRRVRAAVDDRGAALGDLDPVAVAPDAGVHVEVALAVALAVGVVPEADRHRRHRLGDHELADLADQRLAVRVPGLDRRAERARLQLALVDRQQRAAADERGADVGAAAGGEQPRVLADVLVDPAEALGRQRRAGRADGRSCDRSRPSPGSTPAFMHAAM